MAIAGDVFSGWCLFFVFFASSHEMSRMGSGTELRQFLKSFPTYSFILEGVVGLCDGAG